VGVLEAVIPHEAFHLARLKAIVAPAGGVAKEKLAEILARHAW
jgi:hypothetical protein